MLIRAFILFLVICTGCSSGIIPCPEVKGLRLKKSHAGKNFRGWDRHRDEPEPVITVSSDARTPQQSSKNKYRYVRYTIEHVDVEEMDCPKPGEKKIPKSVKENIRKHRKKMRYYYEPGADSLSLVPSSHPSR